MKYKVNKEKCIGCQACVNNCPGATKVGEDGKAEVVDQEKLEKCGGESTCPVGAIEKINENGEIEPQTTPYKPGFINQDSGEDLTKGENLGGGPGRGFGRGMGRGLGRGPRDGRGGGRGGGGRRI